MFAEVWKMHKRIDISTSLRHVTRHILYFMCFLFIIGCKPKSTITNLETYTYLDDYSQTIQVPISPQRVVSTSPAVTEIIYAIHAEDLLVGRTDFCLYPSEAENIESIGGISNLNIEKVASLHPDLIISGSMIPQKTIEHLVAMGIPTACVIEQPQFDGLFDNIAKIGKLTGHQKQADSLIATLKQKLEDNLHRDNRSGNGTSPTCYYVVGYGNAGNFTAGGNTFINDIIALAGGRNIAAGIKGWNYSIEALIKEDPDYIIIRSEDSASFVHTKPYNKLSAVREGHVIGIDGGTIDLQVPRNISAVVRLRERISQ